MKILVTGAAGFIGSHLCETLIEQGHTVTGLDNFDPFYPRNVKESNLRKNKSSERFHFIEGNLSDIQKLMSGETNDFHCVIHLAAKAGVRPSIENPAAYFEANINGTFHVLEWMKTINCKKMIFASSSSVYGNNKKIPFSESDNVDYPISPYAFTKKSCELLNFNYHHLYDFSIINLRFFTVYGPRQRPDLAIHKFFDLIYHNLPIPVFGDGKTGRDYTYIDDTVVGICNALFRIDTSKSKLYEIFNLGNSSPVILNQLIEAIEDVTGKKAIRKNLPLQEGDVDLTFADISSAKQILNYYPKVKLQEGLKRFRDWYEEQILTEQKATL